MHMTHDSNKPAELLADRDVLFPILRDHWLTDLGCSHEGAGSNQAACYCGWAGNRVANVGEAVAQWAAHVSSIAGFQIGEARHQPQEREAVLDPELVQPLKSALRFAASRAAITSEEERGILAALRTTEQPVADEPLRETLESIVAWGDETFGPCTAERAISRAAEEWREMKEPGADVPTEAADVIIVLLRIPGILEAINRKMGINRQREWDLQGDGTGYHKSDTSLSAKGDEA